MEVDNHKDDSMAVDDHHQQQQQQHATIPATPAPASPILPRVAVAETAAMPALQAIAAAYATDNEEENLQIMIPLEERLDVEPLLIPIPMLNQAPPVRPAYKRRRHFRKCRKCELRTHHVDNCPN